MRPMRGSWGRFGGPAGLDSTAARLALGIVVGSVLFAFASRAGLGGLLLLVPGQVIGELRLWQVLTYAFIATDPFSVIISGLVVWNLGGALEQSWGSRRLLTFGLGITAAAGVLTVLLALAFPALLGQHFDGATVLLSVLWVGFGLAWGRAQTNFWGIPLSGNALAGIGAGFVLLNAAFAGWDRVVPSAFAIALTWGYLRLGSPRMLWLRLQSWRLQRQLRGGGSRRRRNHLRVVGGREEERSQDRYLN